MTRTEDWGKEYSKLADLYAKKCKEVRELKDKNKQIRAEILSKAHCEDADCFECAFGSAEGCLLKGENK